MDPKYFKLLIAIVIITIIVVAYRSYTASVALPTAAQLAAATMTMGQSIYSNSVPNTLTSPNGAYKLFVQNTGQVQIFATNNLTTPIWSSPNTSPSASQYLFSLQTDGNICLYNMLPKQNGVL